MLGVGAMGELSLATRPNMKSQVAIKVPHATMAAVGGRLARFQREAEVLVALNNPNVALIHRLAAAIGITAPVLSWYPTL